MTDEPGPTPDDAVRPDPPRVRRWTREPVEDPSPTTGRRSGGGPPGGTIGPRPESMTVAVMVGAGVGALGTVEAVLRIASARPGFAVVLCLICLVLSIGLLFGAYRAFIGADTTVLMTTAAGVLVCAGILQLLADSGRGLGLDVGLLVGPLLVMLLCRVKDSTDWIRLGGGTQF